MSASAPPPEPGISLVDHAFVATLTALVLPVTRDEAREEMLMYVAGGLRPHLSDIHQINRLAICHDALSHHGIQSQWGRSEMSDMRARLTDFFEWRLGCAQEALKRQKD